MVEGQQESAANAEEGQPAEQTQDEPVITQDFTDQVPLSAVYNHDMLNEMMMQVHSCSVHFDKLILLSSPCFDRKCIKYIPVLFSFTSLFF